MIAFWVAAALLSAAVAVLIVLRAARATEVVEAQDPSLGVYRRQLAEIDDLAERGLLPRSEHHSARTEAARRLLAAADTAGPAPGPGGRNRILVVALAAGAPLAALAIYLFVGSPQTPDQPFAGRLASWRAADPASLAPPEMAAVLQTIVAEHPNDPTPLAYLARADLAANDPFSAEQALRRALALAPNRADLWLGLAETLAMQAGDPGAADARAAYQRANALDPSLPAPRYYLARDQIAAGDVQGGLKALKALSTELPANDPRLEVLNDDIAAVEKTGSLPAEQPQAAPVDQQAFIRAMVGRLAARLQAQPDDPHGWGRLIRSYGVLGDEANRTAAIARARAEFKDRPDAWRAVEAAEANPQ